MENKMFNLSPIVFEYNRLAPNNIKPDYSAFLYTPTISVDKAVVVPHTPKNSTPTESPKSTTSPKVVVPVQSTIATAYSPVYRTVGGKKERDAAKNKTEFIKTFLPVYRKVLKEKGISEDFAESLVAQAALESAWGYSPIGKHQVVTNNYIGVKVPSRLRGQGKGQMSGTHEEVNGKMVAINDEFMKFNTLEDMARHHIDLLSRNRYQAFSGSVDEFAQRVKNGGYATASNYVSALNGMINSVRNSGVQIAQRGGQIKPSIVQRLEDRKKFRNFRMTLPPNLRPLSRDYNMRRYWELWGKPDGFYEALTERDGMFSYENDGAFHANTVGPENEKGEGEFMKSRNHPSLYYETDWYNKGITYDNNGKPIPLQGQERKDWEDFRNRYDLDTSRRFYKYVPRK